MKSDGSADKDTRLCLSDYFLFDEHEQFGTFYYLPGGLTPQRKKAVVEFIGDQIRKARYAELILSGIERQYNEAMELPRAKSTYFRSSVQDSERAARAMLRKTEILPSRLYDILPVVPGCVRLCTLEGLVFPAPFGGREEDMLPSFSSIELGVAIQAQIENPRAQINSFYELARKMQRGEVVPFTAGFYDAQCRKDGLTVKVEHRLDGFTAVGTMEKQFGQKALDMEYRIAVNEKDGHGIISSVETSIHVAEDGCHYFFQHRFVGDNYLKHFIRIKRADPREEPWKYLESSHQCAKTEIARFRSSLQITPETMDGFLKSIHYRKE